MSPVKYELGFVIAEDDVLHSPRREALTSYANTVTNRCSPSALTRLVVWSS
jgi:hypothetical protein